MASVEKLGFENLDCYKLALQVLREAYAVARDLPAIERYNLADQMRRAATSATLNIAEGYGRFHYLDKVRFYYIARGSLSEALAAFAACQAAGYAALEDLESHRDLCRRSLQALNGLIRYTYRQQQGQKEYGDRVLRDPEIDYAVIPGRPDRLAEGTGEAPDAESTNPESTNPEPTDH